MATEQRRINGGSDQGYATNGFDFGPTNMPTSAAAVATANARIQNLHFTNTTGASITVTVTDNSLEIGGTGPATILSAPIAANTTVDLDYGERGRPAPGGIKWVATATGCHASVSYLKAAS